MNAFQEEIRAAVREELRAFREELLRSVQVAGGTEDLTTITLAAKACGISADTVHKHYLPRIRKYGRGKRIRISVAELRKAMAEEREGEIDVEAMAERITKRGRR